MTRMRRLIMALGSALLMTFGIASALAQGVAVGATIQEVNGDERSLTVKMNETGIIRTFRIDDSTQIRFERIRRDLRDRRSGFDDLRAGQEVTLMLDGDAVQEEWILLRLITVS